ncbi:hypothetical protein LTR66_000109 [Elasticomyces elasticus]|nr:hypothetical protein LTR66_000109 [Elasticomyces elasticus]
MNRFLARKRAKESYLNEGRESPSPASIHATLPKATKRWRRGRKDQIEQEPEIDLATILPSSDNFRTSLIMPNLSARFSMLREQDDPNSLLGKASDDNVLHPKRQSRLLDFGFTTTGLTDVAEDASMDYSRRPPFATSRQASYVSDDGYGFDIDSARNGNVMTRARPGESNTLFGGRQKVWKVPAGVANSARSPAASSDGRGVGRAVFDDDSSMSAFQKYRQQEREACLERKDKETENSAVEEEDQAAAADENLGQEVQRNHSLDVETEDLPEDLSHSPSPSSYDRAQSTASSTASVPSQARSSTAATSITSSATTPTNTASAPATVPAVPFLDRSLTKSKRLYEQNLDQHMYEQQASTLTRLNSIQRQGTLQRKLTNGQSSPPYLVHTRSAGAIHDKPTPGMVYAARTKIPPPPAPLLTTFGSVRRGMPPNSSPHLGYPQSPLSPTMSEDEDSGVLSSALEPGDRGKATAMGAFNRPQKQFDEQQYLERQKQLQQGREAPVQNNPVTVRFAQLSDVDRPESARDRAGSASSQRSQLRSGPKEHEPGKAFAVFQNAANQMRNGPGNEYQRPAMPDTHRTFFGNISASDSEEDDEIDVPDSEKATKPNYRNDCLGTGQGRFPSRLPAVSEHPALRSAPPPPVQEEEEEMPPVQPLRPVASSRTLKQPSSLATLTKEEESMVAPQVLILPDAPLNGIVHQHLRNPSNQSSVYPTEAPPMDEPPMPDLIKRPTRSTLDSENRVDSSYTNSNPWDLEDFDGYYYGERDSPSSSSPIDPVKPRILPLSSAPSKANMNYERASTVSRDSSMTNGTTWQSELKSQHTRDASTATQQEREAFANELAQRQKAIQENLRSITESHGRATSSQLSIAAPFKGFGILGSKSSRESIGMKEPSTKAIKMLGIAVGSFNASSLSINTQHDRNHTHDTLRKEGSGVPSHHPIHQPLSSTQPRALQQSEQDVKREWGQQRHRGDSVASSRDPSQARNGRSPQSSNPSRNRTRSNSEVSAGRARSRTGRYRDDLDKAMAEGTGSSAFAQHDMPSMVHQQPTPTPSPEMLQHQAPMLENNTSAQYGRARSNSRGACPSYFDSKIPYPIQTANGRLTSSNSSPAGLSPAAYGSTTGPSPRLSPLPSLHSSNTTPSFSAATTPVAPFVAPSAFPVPQSMIRSGSAPLLRKKTISKFDIGEPTLISSTSNVDTVDLPEGASLKNGMEDAPPIPPTNPRRRRTQKLLSAFSRNNSENKENEAQRERSNTIDGDQETGTKPVDLPLRNANAHHEKQQVHGEQSRRRPSDGLLRARSRSRGWEASPLAGAAASSFVANPERSLATDGAMF